MKGRLIHSLFLLTLVWAICPSLAWAINLKPVTTDQLTYTSSMPKGVHCVGNTGKSIELKQRGTPNNSNPPNSQSNSEIRLAPFVVMNGSINVDNIVIAFIIEILSIPIATSYPTKTDVLPQPTLFAVLFRVIISRNAP